MDKRAKKRGVLFALVALILSCALIALVGCSENNTAGSATPTNTSTLRVGVRSNVSGFGYLNEETGRYSGMEIDIAEELATRLGYTDVEFITATPETRKNLLLNDEIDCIIACYSIAATREENFDFSPAYYEDASVVMVEDSSLFTDITDLKGYTFGTVSGANTASQLVIRLGEIGFTSGEALSANSDNSDVQFDNFHLLQLESYQDLSEALEEGTIDAFCGDGCIAQTFKTDDRSLLDFQIDTQEYGVATQKGSALSQPVSDTIQEMLDDGTIDTLIDKWD